MRIVDIGVATGYALVCLSLVAVMNPYGAGSAAAQSSADARAGSAVFQYVQAVGLVYLANSTPAQVCASLQQHSNSTVVFGGTIDGKPCGAAPSDFSGHYEVELDFPGAQDKVAAWVVER